MKATRHVLRIALLGIGLGLAVYVVWLAIGVLP
jgi:hypothetical protein